MDKLSSIDQQLFKAVKKNNLQQVKKLLTPTKWRKAANPNAKTNIGETPVLTAVRLGHLDILKYLIEHGGDINATNSSNQTAIYLAVLYQKLDCVIYLTSKNAHLETVSFDYTALTLAITRGYYQIVNHLVDVGADIEFRSTKWLIPRQQTPLIIAVSEAHSHNFNAENNLKYKTIITKLLEKGVDVNAQDSCGYTALSTAARLGLLDIVKLLVEYGADITIPNIDLKSPIKIAQDYPEIVKFLELVQQNPKKYRTKIKERFLKEIPKLSQKDLRNFITQKPKQFELLMSLGIIAEIFEKLPYSKQIPFYRITNDKMTPEEKIIVQNTISKKRQQQISSPKQLSMA